MSRFIQLPIIIKGSVGYDHLLKKFESATGYLSLQELDALNKLILRLKSSSLINKLYYLHPFVGQNLESKSLNLIDVDKFKITFTSQVTSVESGVVFGIGTGLVDFTDSGASTTDMFISLYASNIDARNIYDIANTTGVRYLIIMKYTGNITLYDCGWTTGVVNEINITGLDLNNKLVVGNTKDGVMSLWQNDTKIEGKAGGIDVGLESLVYNRTAANNPRIYKIGIAGQGLTDEEIITLSSIINEYITSLGRNI